MTSSPAPPAGLPWIVTDNDRRRRQTMMTDAREQNSTGPYTMCKQASNNTAERPINQGVYCLVTIQVTQKLQKKFVASTKGSVI